MQSIVEIVDLKLQKANDGLVAWRKWVCEYQILDDEFVVLFPESNKECNDAGMRYLDTFLERFNGKSAIALTSNKYVQENIKRYSANVREIITSTKTQEDDLLTLYALYPFDHRFRVVSLDKPYCRKSSSMVGVKGTTVEQLIAIGVYGIIPFQSLKKKKTQRI